MIDDIFLLMLLCKNKRVLLASTEHFFYIYLFSHLCLSLPLFSHLCLSLFLSLSLSFSLPVCMHVYVCICVCTCVVCVSVQFTVNIWEAELILHELILSLSTMWVSGIKFIYSGLIVRTFTHFAIS